MDWIRAPGGRGANAHGPDPTIRVGDGDSIQPFDHGKIERPRWTIGRPIVTIPLMKPVCSDGEQVSRGQDQDLLDRRWLFGHDGPGGAVPGTKACRRVAPASTGQSDEFFPKYCQVVQACRQAIAHRYPRIADSPDDPSMRLIVDVQVFPAHHEVTLEFRDGLRAPPEAGFVVVRPPPLIPAGRA